MNKLIKVTAVRAEGSKDASANNRSMEQFKTRESQEIIVAFMGPIACSLPRVINETDSMLKKMGYEVHRVKISDFLQRTVDKGLINVVTRTGSRDFVRYNALQDAGKNIRIKLGEHILAEYVMSEIARIRTQSAPSTPLDEITPRRAAYLIDQLKHPEEIEILRTVYRKLFHLIGVTAFKQTRQNKLVSGGVLEDEAAQLIERDRREDEELGQQLEKALKLADLYIHNSSDASDHNVALSRFFDLVHDTGLHTPSRAEFGMYVAQSAAAKAACLSRQVGAAILSASGEVLATGRNDVPAAGGGLYDESHGVHDKRCFNHGGYCRNVRRKDSMRSNIHQALSNLRDTDPDLNGIDDRAIEKMMGVIYENSQIKSLIEFSRSVHAEMDAITSTARDGRGPIKGATLYSTTFPCHSCARHIVAAGIREVIYIEPYEKSLAAELHDDAISFDEEVKPIKITLRGSEVVSAAPLVRFVHFEGIAPRAYLQLFQQKRERKDANGSFVAGSTSSGKKIPEYRDSYMDFEARGAANFTLSLERLNADPTNA